MSAGPLTPRARVVFCAPGAKPEPWVALLATHLPDMDVFVWSADDAVQADYAVVWSPPAELFATQRHLKATFNLGAGVDALMRMPSLPAGVPVVRLDDAGMSVQMAEYVCHAVIRYTRDFAQFEADTRAGLWKLRRPTERGDFPVGVMGLGVIGARVATALRMFEFPVAGWSRSQHELPGVRCYAGADGLDEFLRATRVLVCVLPLTADTADILNRANLEKLRRGAYLINVARGAHLVEDDLIPLIDSGQLSGATLDVFREEPLPPEHPFWRHAAIHITPHISARTLRDTSLAQIAGKIAAFERGAPIIGVVDRARGY